MAALVRLSATIYISLHTHVYPQWLTSRSQLESQCLDVCICLYMSCTRTEGRTHEGTQTDGNGMLPGRMNNVGRFAHPVA